MIALALRPGPFLAIAAALIVLTPHALPGQSASPSFEVASVKPNTSGVPMMRIQPTPGRYDAINVSLRVLVRLAYDLQDHQLEGGPDWMNRDRFDVAAKAEGNPPPKQQLLMLRQLLAERFKLVARYETRELPIYVLRASQLGRQLRRSAEDCAAIDNQQPLLRVGQSPAAGPPPCGHFGFSPSTDLRAGRGGMAFRGLTMPTLASYLVPMLRRTVVDQTNLEGYFDGEFDFLAEMPPPPPPPGVPNPFGLDSFRSIFSVFPEQLGLKLEPTKGPVQVLVVESAERPTPD